MKRCVALALAATTVVTMTTAASAQPGAPAPPPPPAPEEPAPPPAPTPPGRPAPPPGWQPAPIAAAPAPAPQLFKRTKRYPLKVLAADAASMGAFLIGATLLISEGFDDDGDAGDEGPGLVLVVGGALGMFLGSPLVHLSEDNSSSAWKALGIRLGIPMVMSLLTSSADGDADREDAAASLTGLLFLGGVVFDYAVLAKVEVSADFAVSPYAAPTAQGGMTMGLGGRF